MSNTASSQPTTMEHSIVGDTAINASNASNTSDGFFSSLISSVFEPGVNKSLFISMNLSFLFLEITLLGLAFLTHWNWHVVFLAIVSLGLWGAMVWFIHEITTIQSSSQNQPPSSSLPISPPTSLTAKGDSDDEEDKERETEVVKSEVEVEMEFGDGLRSRSGRKG